MRALAVAVAAAAALTDVQAPALQVDLRYAMPQNITGAPLPGYRCRTRALLRPKAARRLVRVHRDLEARGLGLRVFDAYRPVRATRALVRWAERTGRGDLVTDGYIARRSRHNVGVAVDLTLVRLRTGRALDMGTPYDALDPRAHTRSARGRALRNRLTLLRAMERRGFEGYPREWWHFELPVRAGLRPLHRAVRCR
jgi:D-alanyl-D-alanine dipeptidase